MNRVWLIIALTVVVGLVASCAGEGADSSNSAQTTDGAAVSSTAVTTTEPPDGPCLDERDHMVASTSVYVSGEAASFGYATYSHCPWLDTQESDMAADGFFADLEQVRVEAESAGTIQVEALGYPGADLAAGWQINATDESEVADVSALGSGRWEVSVPDRDGVYTLQLHLEWSTGDAVYAATVVVGDPVENEALVPD